MQRAMTQNETAEFLRKRPAVARSADPPPPPQCGACGSFLPIDAQYAPATCPNCSVELPPDPKAAPGKSARPWRIDRKWIEALCDSFAKFTKGALDRELGVLKGEIGTLTARVGQLETELAELKAKRAKRVPKAAK